MSERQGAALSLWMNVIERLLAQGESFNKRLEVSERQGVALSLWMNVIERLPAQGESFEKQR